MLGGPAELFHSLVHYRHIIGQFTRREVLGRYRGSYMGIFWTFLNPLLLLGIFTLVFKFVFHAKFTGNPHEGSFDFALLLFSGLIVYNLFAECLGRSPTLILSNANYVTKVVFPLEILPVTVVLSGVLHLLISFVPLCLGVAFLRAFGQPASVPHGLPLTILYWPLLLLPIFCWSLGVTLRVVGAGRFHPRPESGHARVHDDPHVRQRGLLPDRTGASRNTRISCGSTRWRISARKAATSPCRPCRWTGTGLAA